MDATIKKSFAFILGREQEIALAELKAVLGRFCFSFDIYKITGNVVFANIDNFTEDDARELMNALAGTMKIFELETATGKDIASQIAETFEERKRGISGKINFGLSYYGKGFSRQNINSIALTAKKKLKDNYSLRYVESRDSFDLSTILTLKSNLLGKGIEFGLFDNIFGVLVAFNNPEEWNKRDYGKPASDKYSGMVPPKLARMMVNLALGQIQSSVISNQSSDYENRKPKTENCLVLDPFCGSGNILMEAMMLGYDVVGSDISEKAVTDSKTNLEWFTNQYSASGIQHPVFKADATSSEYLQLLTTNCSMLNTKRRLVVVTEPFLGEPKKYKPVRNAAYGEYEKIKELYLEFLKNIAKLSNGSIADRSGSDSSADNNTTMKQFNNCILCLIFPLVETSDGRRFSLYNESVDEIKKLGYTQACNSFVYGRDYQVVKREIVLLQLKQKSQIQNHK